MKTILLSATLALRLAAASFGHQDIEIGPNGGRVFDLDSKTTPHMEIGVKDSKFVVHLLDAKDKPIPLGERTLTISAGERSNPQKLSVQKSGDAWTAPVPKGEAFPAIFRVYEKGDAKPLTARVNYDSKRCPECQKAEWLCACGSKKTKK